MKVTYRNYEALMEPWVAIPTPEELFGFQVRNLVEKGVIKSREEVKGLRKRLPEKGMLLVVPETKLLLDELMERVVVGGEKGRTSPSFEYLKDKVKTPKKPYLCLDVEDGRKMLGKSPKQCLQEFKEQKRSELTALEGIILLISFPEILKHHYIDLPGSRIDGSDEVPYVFLGNGDQPELYWNDLANSDDRWGSASCGSRVGL